MGDRDEFAVSEASGWCAPAVWAHVDTFDDNPVSQLLVPESAFSSVAGGIGHMELRNSYGSWPAATPDAPVGQDVLWAVLPQGAQPGDHVTAAHWNTPDEVSRHPTDLVLESFRDAISYAEADDDTPGLRTPQLGAMHAVLGYWTTKRMTPATVVMPTGTGKTETMLALMVAARPTRLLVLVPSDALRDQVASKFESLGVLQELGIVSWKALRPAVGRLQHGFSAVNTATAFAEACNVVVATPASLGACSSDGLAALLGSCSHLFIDEAHHVAARTWSEIRRAFEQKPVVQFTATPFREDGKHLHGRTIYSFPLREAQAQGYFSHIDYTAVIDFDDIDRAVATHAVDRLRADLALDLDHVLMARVRSVDRAKQVLPLYQDLAPDLGPVIMNSRMAKGRQREALVALRDRSSRIIVCVNMLGEGFDLPALKIAAVHDPQKSLGVSLQFIGRFARTSADANIGPAAMFVARREIELDRRLRTLYAEDSDWNLILRNLSEAVIEDQQQVSDFEEGFTSLPDEVTLRSLLPKLSTVVYKAPSDHWDPQAIVDFFGEENLLTTPIGINADAGVAWCVLERREDVRWGDLRTIEEVSYQLFVLYFDSDRKLLYINNSANDGVFQDLAAAVLGPGATRFTGSTVYRVMADIDRLVPTNVGVLDAHDRFRRFSMHVGSDVIASFSQAEAGTKSQTNISGGGYREGEHVSISASIKGRIWSHATATSLKHWCDWCDSIGEKLLDDTISIDKVIGQFILPQPLTARPNGVLLAVEWPWQLHVTGSDLVKLSFGDDTYEAVFTDLVPDVTNTTGPFRFSIRTPAWQVVYEADADKDGLRYKCVGPDEITVVRPNSQRPLSEWLNDNGLTFILDEDRLIEGDHIYKPTWDRPPFDTQNLIGVDWSGTTITVESQGETKLTDSIQYRAIADLKAEAAWDIIIDDDGSGEMADIVAMRVDESDLTIRLVHCKYSHGDAPGARVADLYEVCGQAQKSIMWRRSELRPFFKTLENRARKKLKRTGVSPFEVGDIKKLYEIQERSLVLRRRIEIVIVQPGLSASAASTQQLDLLASTQAYLLTTINAPLTVICSP